MMRYFLKELVSNKLFLPNGARVPFEDVGDDTGILATSDGFIISEMEKAIHRHVGGVIEIDQAQYEDLKKNPRKPARSLNYRDEREMRRVVQDLQRQLDAARGTAAAVKQQEAARPAQAPSAPVVVPKTIPRPPTRRAAAARRQEDQSPSLGFADPVVLAAATASVLATADVS